MKKFLGILPLLVAILVSVSAVFYTAVSAVGISPLIKGETLNSGDTPLKDMSNLFTFSGFTNLKNESAVSSSSASSALVSAKPGEAIGKIYEQFLSPYSAKLAYNGIYIKNSTGLNINIKEELEKEFKLKISAGSEPQVLIVHTHATESFLAEERNYYTATDKSRDTNNQNNVTHLGEIVANKLKAAGIGVIHDKTQHDYPAYNGSYSRAKTTITEYLKKYPSIKIVIDLHRDSIDMKGQDKCKPTVLVKGKKAAQVMLVMGSETGTVTNFPNWRENLKLALRYQQTMEALYPGLARAMTFCSRCYNENLTTGSMILEVGTDSNSFKEACYSAELAGEALVSLLNRLK